MDGRDATFPHARAREPRRHAVRAAGIPATTRTSPPRSRRSPTSSVSGPSRRSAQRPPRTAATAPPPTTPPHKHLAQPSARAVRGAEPTTPIRELYEYSRRVHRTRKTSREPNQQGHQPTRSTIEHPTPGPGITGAVRGKKAITG